MLQNVTLFESTVPLAKVRSHWSRVGPTCNVTGVLLKGNCSNRHMQGGHGEEETDWGDTYNNDAKDYQPSFSRGSEQALNRFCLTEGTRPANALILDSGPPEPWKQQMSVVKALRLWHRQPSRSASSKSLDSTNPCTKNIWKKFQKAPESKSELAMHWHHWHSIYMALGI